MAIITEEITLDISHPEQWVRIRLQQNDANEKQIDVNITDDGDTYIIPTSGTTIVFEMMKPDNKPIYNTCSVVNNKARFLITEQMTAASGMGVGRIKITDSTTGGEISTIRFYIYIDKEVINTAIITSSGEFTALTDALLQLTGYQTRFNQIGDLSQLTTTSKTDLVGAVNEVKEEITSVESKSRLTVNVEKYNLPTNGTSDCLSAFNQAIAEVNTMGGGTIVAPYNVNGYSISDKLTLIKNTELNLYGSLLKPIGSLASTDGSILFLQNNNNTANNIIFDNDYTQYGIEFGATSSNNIEMNCKCVRGYNGGYNNLVKTETENANAHTNVSLSVKANEKGKSNFKTVHKIKATVSVNASQYANNIRLIDFPSICRITRLKITDDNGSPNYSVEIVSKDTAPTLYYYVRGQATSDIDTTVLDDYYRLNRDDVIRFGIYNYKASNTTFTIEVWFEDPVYTSKNKVWQYNSEEDFNRPHTDNVGANSYVSLTTMRQVEYRFKDSLNNLCIMGVTPTRDSNISYLRPKITLPTPAGLTQDASIYSEIKYYLNYPASRAVLDKPTKVVFSIYGIPKQTKANLIVGWYSQAPEGQTNYMENSSIVEKEVTIPATASNSSPYEIVVNLDPKGYQKGSALEGDNSENFLYFVLHQKDATYTPYLFGETYLFNTYIYKEQ